MQACTAEREEAFQPRECREVPTCSSPRGRYCARCIPRRGRGRAGCIPPGDPAGLQNSPGGQGPGSFWPSKGGRPAVCRRGGASPGAFHRGGGARPLAILRGPGRGVAGPEASSPLAQRAGPGPSERLGLIRDRTVPRRDPCWGGSLRPKGRGQIPSGSCRRRACVPPRASGSEIHQANGRFKTGCFCFFFNCVCTWGRSWESILPSLSCAMTSCIFSAA